MSIRSRAEYDDVLAFLTTRDTRRRPHHLPMEAYTWSDGEFFLTLCARQHDAPFRDACLAHMILEALRWRRAHHHWRLYGYCLMPDHLHLLVGLPEYQGQQRHGGSRGWEPASLLSQIADFKSYTTSQLWWKQGGTGPLWQHSSHDRLIRYNETVEHAVAYRYTW